KAQRLARRSVPVIKLIGTPAEKSYDCVMGEDAPGECTNYVVSKGVILMPYKGTVHYCVLGGDYDSADTYDVAEAVEAARSARFEFGESGAPKQRRRHTRKDKPAPVPPKPKRLFKDRAKPQDSLASDQSKQIAQAAERLKKSMQEKGASCI